MAYDADVIVIGAGLAGLAATAELADAGRKVILLDQEPEQSLGGQAHWSFGGLFLVDSPEQRRLRIRDSHELAWQDWLGTAGFDRPEDHWPRKWAEAYVDFAAGEKRSWLHRPGRPALPRRRLGRARRLRRDRARQLRAPLPHHLGHRARSGRAVRAPGAGRASPGAWSSCASATGSTGLVAHRGRVDTVSGEVLEPLGRRARQGQQPRGGRRLRAARPRP